MALSNILVEPRREITETLVGLGVVAIALSADYKAARWLLDYPPAYTPKTSADLPYLAMGVVLMIGVPLVLLASGVVITLLAMGVHAIGDGICGLLARHGVHLRPRQRWMRQMNWETRREEIIAVKR